MMLQAWMYGLLLYNMNRYLEWCTVHAGSGHFIIVQCCTVPHRDHVFVLVISKHGFWGSV